MTINLADKAFVKELLFELELFVYLNSTQLAIAEYIYYEFNPKSHKWFTIVPFRNKVSYEVIMVHVPQKSKALSFGSVLLTIHIPTGS